MKKCTICNEEFKKNQRSDLDSAAERLGTGEWICADCVDESTKIAICEECEKWHWVEGMTKLDGYTYCKTCFEQEVVKIFDDHFTSLKDVNELRRDEGEAEETPEEYVVYLLSEIDDVIGGRSVRRKMKEMVSAGLGQNDKRRAA